VAEEYKKSPVAAGTTVINRHRIKELYLIVSKYPSPKVLAVASGHIRNIIDKTNLTAAAEFAESLVNGVETSDDALMGIKCSDTIPRAESLEGESLLLVVAGEVVGVD
jgi:hypothetical protein